MTKTSPPLQGFPLGPTLGFLRALWGLNHAIERRSKRMEQALGVTAQQRIALRVIGKYPGLTLGQLAGVLTLDAGTVSASVGRLERRGLVERRVDSRDRRRALVGLTAAGRALDVASEGTVESAVEAVLASTPASETASTQALLGRLVAELLDDAERRPRRPKSKR